MSAGRETVTVRVPGSTSNCGSGFDTLGLALTLYNRVTLTRAAGDAGQPERPSDARAQAMVSATAAGFARVTGRDSGGFSYRIEGEVPRARGLGSSATIIVGVLAGLDALHGNGWSRHELATLATALEGNPDNVSPAILGGFTVSRCDPVSGAYVDTIRLVAPAELVFVVASPEIETSTKASRGALPASLPFFDAAKSVNHAAYLVAAFATGDFEKLCHARGDLIHEPYRLPKIPGAREAIAAGIAAGALTGWLSGSGSSVLCVARPAVADAVTEAMNKAFGRVEIRCTTRVLAADNAGLKVE